ncbi:hypothetical protein [Rossellomorea aquimaris]|nr:hypothetical protein [Rossellomorea aquimaris]
MIAGISWTKWIRFMMPLLLIWIVMGSVFLMIGVHFKAEADDSTYC